VVDLNLECLAIIIQLVRHPMEAVEEVEMGLEELRAREVGFLELTNIV
jgi:hypothetical protein